MSNLLVEWLGCVGRTTFYNQCKPFAYSIINQLSLHPSDPSLKYVYMCTHTYIHTYLSYGFMINFMGADVSVRKVEDDSRVSKLISQYYDSQPSGQSTTPYIELATLKGDQY